MLMNTDIKLTFLANGLYLPFLVLCSAYTTPLFAACYDDNMTKDLCSVASMCIINIPSIFNTHYNFRQNGDGSAVCLMQKVDMAIKSHHEFNNSWNNIISTLSKDSECINAFNKIYASRITKDETRPINIFSNMLAGQYIDKQLGARL